MTRKQWRLAATIVVPVGLAGLFLINPIIPIALIIMTALGGLIYSCPIWWIGGDD